MKPVWPVITSTAMLDERLRNVEYAKDQMEYLTLPAIKSSGVNGRVTTRWRLTWSERLRIIFSGNLWIQMLTFHERLQPIRPTTEEPTVEECL
jgi:hypothetical protein